MHTRTLSGSLHETGHDDAKPAVVRADRAAKKASGMAIASVIELRNLFSRRPSIKTNQRERIKERRQVEDDIETQLSEINDEIANLKNQAREADGDREIELQGEIAKLETKCDQAQERLRELRAASGDKWAQLKIKADESWKDVSDSVKQKVEEWKDDLKDGETKDNGEPKNDSDE